MDAEQRIKKALEFADWGQADGAHHKAWAIDQMVRALLGDEAYGEFVAEYEQGGEYEWQEGIAP